MSVEASVTNPPNQRIYVVIRVCELYTQIRKTPKSVRFLYTSVFGRYARPRRCRGLEVGPEYAADIMPFDPWDEQ